MISDQVILDGNITSPLSIVLPPVDLRSISKAFDLLEITLEEKKFSEKEGSSDLNFYEHESHFMS